MTNPFFRLNYESCFADLGDDYYDLVAAAEFAQHNLRFRNDALLPPLGLQPTDVNDQHFIEAFGQFGDRRPFLAQRYHGYQFGEYNPFIGDGRGFLYGQVRGSDGQLYDLGTKGSGQTPYSRQADGRLTLKGGIREILAGEALHYLGVNTSRCLSLVETGEALWRMDEPSPTRGAVMVRMSRSHIRFGTFERLHYINRRDLIGHLLDHVIACYYPAIAPDRDRYAQFYQALVERVALLTAQWMAAGFCHGVLNTDNMSITGESFDYGPYAFIPSYDPQFVAAYFDYGGRYRFGNQPWICRFNLEMLQKPLAMVSAIADLETGLAPFDKIYEQSYQRLMLHKLGLEEQGLVHPQKLVHTTLQFLKQSQIGYHQFFAELAQQFNADWRAEPTTILDHASFAPLGTLGPQAEQWQQQYHHALNQVPWPAFPAVGDRLQAANPPTALLRPVIEAIWDPIVQDDHWEPFEELIRTLQTRQ